MKRYFYLIFLLSLSACGTSQKENMVTIGGVDDAINNAIIDFTHTEKRLLKGDDSFLVSAETLEEIIVVTIIGDPNTVLLIGEEDGTYDYRAFPTMLVEIDGKMFFWYDEGKSTTDTIINTLYRHNFVDTMIVNAYIPDRIIDDAKRGVVYYFCKNDLINYKKTGTNTLTKSYKPPRLRCKK